MSAESQPVPLTSEEVKLLRHGALPMGPTEEITEGDPLTYWEKRAIATVDALIAEKERLEELVATLRMSENK